jgi:cytochrome c-type biogenesis protein CcmH
MTYFYLAAAVLVVVALALLLRPWWRSSSLDASAVPSGDTSAANAVSALNAAIHRDRLGELERDHSNGTLSDADLAEAREELQRQLLDDTAATEVVASRSFSRSSGIAIALVLPLIAVALYALLGSPAAVLPAAVQTQRATADMEQLVIKLASKLEQNPGNPEGWAMLARSYKSLGRWDDAERAFVRIGPDLNRNAELLAELAEMLVQKNNGFDDRSRGLVRQALRVEPNNMLALFMGGGEAFDSGRYAEAAALWERLLPQLEAGGEDARMVEASIAKARARSGGARATAPAAKSPAKAAASSNAKSVSGRVELSPALKDKAKPDDVVFIFARAVEGPRMPLAAKRIRVADLPLDFMLDDSQAVMPGATISSVPQLRVEARVSKSGTAQAGKGDLTGKSSAVKPGAAGLRIIIDQVDP